MARCNEQIWLANMNETMLLGVAPWVAQWLTPIWILSAGVTAGILALVVIWGLFYLGSRIPGVSELGTDPKRRTVAAWVGAAILAAVYFYFATPFIRGNWERSGPNLLLFMLLLTPICYILPRSMVMLLTRRSIREVPEAVREGVLWPLLIVALSISVFTVMGIGLIRNPQEYFRVLQRWATVGNIQKTFSIPVPSADASVAEYHPIDVTFHRNEVRMIRFQSSENVEIRSRPIDEDITMEARLIEITSRDVEQVPANPGSMRVLFRADEVNRLWVLNRGAKPAEVTIFVDFRPAIPEVAAIPLTAIAVVGLFLLYFMQRASFPRMSAVALATAKSEMGQPLFVILAVFGVLCLGAFIFIPGNTFGEDIKILKDSGLTLIKVLACFQAIWAAGVSVAEEIEGRTALTVLSKPIDRRAFILGKFVGISWTAALMFIILGSFFILFVAYKPIYDAREGANDDPTWQICFWEATRVIPGMVLAYMETMVLASISVAISTRLPMVANFTICFTIYLLGNLAPLIVQKSEDQFPIVQFFAQLIATVFPNLENFNTYAAIAGGKDVPVLYLGGAGLYCLIFTFISMLLALLLFEDRDLA